MIDSTLTLPNGVTLKNRIVKSAMSEALGDENNNPTPAMISLFGQWSAGGAGVLITGNTPIDRMHLEHAGNFALDETSDLTLVKELTTAAKSGGAKVLAQLAHAGRQTPEAINPHPTSMSDQRLDLPGYGQPVTATTADFEAVIAKFTHSALLAQEAGFDGVEIHSAHGYLLSSSLSPRINTRDDQWGGSLENRARLTVNVVHAVRTAVRPDFIVAVKLNSSDFQKGGFDHNDSVKVAVMLESEGVDFIEISGGTFETPTAYQHTSKSQSTVAREGYFLEYASAIKSALRIPLMVTGGFRSKSVMDQAINNQQTDLIGIGRPFITAPDFPNRMLAGELETAPTVERDFPPTESIPRSSVLNWFCTQLANLGRNGKATPDLALIEGHKQYLEQIERTTAWHLSARAT